MRKGDNEMAINRLIDVIEKIDELCETTDELMHIKSKAYNNLGLAYYSVSKFREGNEAMQRSNDIDKELGHLLGYVLGITNYAFNLIDQGLLQEAISYADEALEIDAIIHDQDSKAFALGIKGCALLELGDHTQAQNLLKEAINISNVIQANSVLTYWYFALAKICLATNDILRAKENARRAYEVAEKAELELEKGYGLVILGHVAMFSEEWEEAQLHFDKAIASFIEQGVKLEVGIAKRYYGLMHLNCHELNQGRILLEESYCILSTLGYEYQAGLTEKIIGEYF
jgi:tetratricopeptide (TPR) repeat protein